MLGKLVPQPENQLEYPLKQSIPKSDPVTEGSALQAELRSGPFSGPGGDGSNSIFRLNTQSLDFTSILAPLISLTPLPVIA